MNLVRILERKGVIRLFGTALVLSPVFNTFASLWLHHGAKPWTFALFWKIAMNGTSAKNVLDIAGVLIGLVMLSGVAAAWRFVLGLMAGHILLQVLNFGANIRASWLHGLFFLINVSVFLFIADQLVWKQKTTSPQKIPPQPEPLKEPVIPTPASAAVFPLPPRSVAPIRQADRQVMVQFEGFGTWARLVNVAPGEFRVRSTGPQRPDFLNREIEVIFKSGLHFRAKLKQQVGSEFIFEYPPLNKAQTQALNQWLTKQMSAA